MEIGAFFDALSPSTQASSKQHVHPAERGKRSGSPFADQKDSTVKERKGFRGGNAKPTGGIGKRRDFERPEGPNGGGGT